VPLARELPHVKALSHLIAMMARRQARDVGADEALLTDAEGRVLEGAGSNVFAVVRGRLVTAPADAGLLAGVTRAVVLELARAAGIDVAERRLDVSELAGADEAFLTSTTRELVPLRALDGRTIGSGSAGTVTRRLQEAYAAEVARERAAAR
jgi:branched-subunit amino acid aminotransferase/4-amino-4-deoxychorismate lyase